MKTVIITLAFMGIVAAQTQIDWNTQIRNRPVLPVMVTGYNFPASTPAGTLTASTPASVTLSSFTVCPVVGDWLYIPSGTAEIVNVTAASGIFPNCSVTFTPTNSHTAGYSVQSACAGGQEALNFAIAAGPYRHVHYPAGSYLCYGPIVGHGASNILIDGEKGATVVDLAYPSALLTETTATPWVANITIGTGSFFINQGSTGTTATVGSDVNMSGGVYSRYSQSTTTVTVSSLPVDWAVGNFIGIQYQGWGTGNGGQQEFHQIARIEGISTNTLTFNDPIVVPIASATVNSPPSGGVAGHNQSLLTKLNLVNDNWVRDITFTTVGSTYVGSVGGPALYYTQNSGVSGIECQGYINNGCVIMGYAWNPRIEDTTTYLSAGFSDVWAIGTTHLTLSHLHSEYPSFGPGVWWSTFPTVSDVDSTGAGLTTNPSRGMKIHGVAWGNFSDLHVNTATKTGLGIAGGTYNSNFSNLECTNSATPPNGSEVCLYFSGEGNLNNKVTNAKVLNGGGPSGQSDMTIGTSFGLSDDYNTIVNGDFPGGWTDGGLNNSVNLSTNIAAGAYNSGGITLSTGVGAAITFDTKQYDYGGTPGTPVHSTSSNTDRFIIPNSSQGVYRVTCTVTFASNATGYRAVWVSQNGSGTFGQQSVGANPSVATALTALVDLTAVGGDILRCNAIQTSGGNLNTSGGAGATQMTISRVR